MTESRLVTIDEVCLFVEYDYIPEEPMVTYYPDGSGHPGSAAEVQVLKAYAGEVDIFNLLSQSQIEDIEIQILESYD